MKSLSVITFMVFAFNMLLAPFAHSAFNETYSSARVAGLGGAYTAMSDDATGIFYNPAAGTTVGRKQVNFSYSKLLMGMDEVNLSLGNFAYAQPLGKRNLIGIGWNQLNAVDLYREDVFVLSLSRNLLKDGKVFAVGASAKMLMRAFDMNDQTSADPVFREGGQKSVPAIDLHAYSVPAPEALPGLSLGFTARSVNRPDIGYKSEEKLPMELVGGLVYRWKNFAFPIDVSSRDGELNPRFGTEVKFLRDMFALRLGGDLYQVGMGLGVAHSLTERLALTFDYAFIMPLVITETSGSHRASFGLKF